VNIFCSTSVLRDFLQKTASLDEKQALFLSILCSMPENQYDVTSEKHISVKHPKDVTEIICSHCMQILVNASQDKIKTAYQKAIHAGLMGKAKTLGIFLEEEEPHDRKAETDRPNMVRSRTLRTIKFTHHQVRPKHPVRQLDKKRTAVC